MIDVFVISHISRRQFLKRMFLEAMVAQLCIRSPFKGGTQWKSTAIGSIRNKD